MGGGASGGEEIEGERVQPSGRRGHAVMDGGAFRRRCMVQPLLKMEV